MPRFRDIINSNKGGIFEKQDETALPSLAADFPVSRFQAARETKRASKIPATCRNAQPLQSLLPCAGENVAGFINMGPDKTILTLGKSGLHCSNIRITSLRCRRVASAQ